MSERTKRAFYFDYNIEKHGISKARLDYMKGRLVGIAQTVLDGEEHLVRTSARRKSGEITGDTVYINATDEEMEKIERIFSVHKTFPEAIIKLDSNK